MSRGSAYSCGAPLGRPGISTIALHAADGLARAGLLQRLIVSSHVNRPHGDYAFSSLGLAGRALKKLAFYDTSGRATHLADAAYDAWAATRLGPCRVFHGWAQMSLRQMRRAKQLGAVTIVERASSHALSQAKLLAEEALRWNLGRPLTVARGLRLAAVEYAEADFIAVPSEFAYQSFLDHNIPAEKLVLIPFGFDGSPPTAVGKRGAGEFRALFVGTLSARKGVPDLLEAWRLADLPNARLILAGGAGPEIAPWIAQMRDDARIEWRGFTPDPAALYQGADVFVFPSIEEGSALVTYEAMAHGLPLIVTPNAGSVARDGEHGFLVPIRDTAALAERLRMLANDPGLRRRMGQAAQQHVRAYTWLRYGDRVAEAHRRLSRGEKPDGPGWLAEAGAAR